MHAYEYQALDANGRVKRGIVSADSPKGARRELKAQHLVPLKVLETRDKGTTPGKRSSRAALSFKELTLVTRQLATLIGAAAPVEQALGTIANQAEKGATKQVLLAVRGDVLEGRRLSDALKAQPKSFNTLFVALVAAAENAGTLPAVLERLADHMEKSRAIANKVSTALIYPIVLTLVAIAVVIGLMTFVVPKIAAQFNNMGQELPGLTQFMISASNVIAAYWLYAVVLIFAAVSLFGFNMRRQAFRKRVHQIILKLPLIGRLSRELNAARFARTMSTLSAAQVPIVSGLEATHATISNEVLKDAIKTITEEVKEGKSLSNAMRRSGTFPIMLVYMVASGENSGALPELLGKAADYLENEFERFTSSALSLLEPIIIVIMGGVVATIVLSILMPILQQNSLAAL